MLPFNRSSWHTEVGWLGVRGWFDECVGKPRGGDDGFFRTTHSEERRDEAEKWRDEPRDGYYGPDCILGSSFNKNETKNYGSMGRTTLSYYSMTGLSITGELDE
ncbi:hypothetical protein M413DRAFT_445774 [Hebeloma cylindrosporum]|uniref:Uncharacterized protein n=1 Tax=Hebeloma cylindrosporum TaxID=76867 RepID=A0A0C3CBN0_HEBCY|nr:hypothetical protein M413DRAFT_445774 [Hebeloma cylindrosporum h7]